MEFVKVGKNYLIKDSNGRIVTEKEKLELENKELVLEDINSSVCVKLFSAPTSYHLPCAKQGER